MEKQWFVLHTLSGQEMKVRESIERRIKQEEMQDYIDQVLIPTEKVSEVKQGRKTTTTRKFYPGYVLVHMCLYNDQRGLMEKTWYFTQQTPGIIGFVGGERPVPLRPEEVDPDRGKLKVSVSIFGRSAPVELEYWQVERA